MKQCRRPAHGSEGGPDFVDRYVRQSREGRAVWARVVEGSDTLDGTRSVGWQGEAAIQSYVKESWVVVTERGVEVERHEGHLVLLRREVEIIGAPLGVGNSAGSYVDRARDVPWP